MKQIAKTWISPALIVVLSVLSLSASADSFQYDFGDDLKEDDWELWGNNSVWQVEDGFLRAAIQPNDFNAALFQFKGIPGNYENFEFFADNRFIQRQKKKPGHESFTITVKNMGSKRTAGFGVAIGRRFPDLPDLSYFYIFFTYGIQTQAYKWSVPNVWGEEDPRHPDTFWDTGELVSMEIRFNRGHFQWFANNEKRADFEDPEFSPIEIIGFMVISDGVHVGSGWVDSFTIAGSRTCRFATSQSNNYMGTNKRHEVTLCQNVPLLQQSSFRFC